jgi:hypothetical protein
MQVCQFWPIPLSNGIFACGIVLDLVDGRKNEFLAGLVNWSGSKEPKSEDIVGLGVVDQGIGHINMIQEGYGWITGVLPPGTKPPSSLLWTEHLHGSEWGLYRGLKLTKC